MYSKNISYIANLAISFKKTTIRREKVRFLYAADLLICYIMVSVWFCDSIIYVCVYVLSNR